MPSGRPGRACAPFQACVEAALSSSPRRLQRTRLHTWEQLGYAQYVPKSAHSVVLPLFRA
jgi:hypothetical protein